MWSALPRETQEYIYRKEVPMHVANVDTPIDIDGSETRVAGLAQRDGETLFVKSAKDGREWELPGGRIDPGEGPEVAVKREFKEETGFDVTTATPVIALVWTLPEANVVQLVFRVDLGEQVGEPVDEVRDLDWFEELPEPISFGEEGANTYEFLVNNENVTIEFPDGRIPGLLETAESHKRSLAVGAGAAVAGGAVAVGLARRLLSKRDA